MNRFVMNVLAATCLFALVLSVVLALPNQLEEFTIKEYRSPAIDDDFPTFDDEDHTSKPAEFSIGNLIAGQAGKFFNEFLQLPSTIFKFLTGFFAKQPFAKLREEVRNLNISYPK